tara:strand:- start:4960 stop:6573 length:1614 start_codon:yes stop_codon:yes gene_type:complete
MKRKTLNIKQLKNELQHLLDESGHDGFVRAKALFLKDVDIVDADGMPIEAGDVDVEISVGPEVAAAMEGDEAIAVEEIKAEESDEELLDEELLIEEEEEEDEEVHPKRYIKATEDPYEESNRQKLRLGLRLGGGAGAGKPRSRRGGHSLGGGGRGGGGKGLDVSSAVKKELAKMNPRKKAMQVRQDIVSGHKFGSIKHFSGADADLRAYRFGRWAMACMGHKKSVAYCQDYGIQIKGQVEGVNTAGGYLVPDEFSDQLINLREQYGVFRANAHIEPMSSDTKRIPRRDSTVTAYFTGEASAGTESEQAFSQVNLVAKKLMILTSISNELSEDSLINLGDTVAGEIAYAFSLKEDQCGFLGDGTGTYGGIVGLNSNIAAGGTVDAGHSTIDQIDIDDLHNMMALLPAYADTPNAKWYMHKSIFAGTIEKIVYNAGGVTAREIKDGAAGTSAFGYPVVFSQVLPSQSGASDGDTLMYFGDLSQAAYMGDRRSNTISFSDSALNAFEQDEIIVRGTERFDIVTTNLGDASTAGSVVKLVL